MTRLTNDLRSEIATQAIKHAFLKQNEKIAKDEAKIGLKLYKSIFPKSERDSIANLDKKWFHMDKCLRFNCGGYDLRFTVTAIEPNGVAVPNNENGWCRSLANISGDLAIEGQAFASKKEDHKKKESDAERSLMAILYSVNTVKRLSEIWPDGKKYFEHLLVEVEKTGVPAVKIEELNKILGLKS